MKRDRFIVLPYSLHEEHMESLIARVVVDPLDPLRRFIPEDAEKSKLGELCPGILPKPISYGSRADVIRNASTKDLGIILTMYFELCGKKDKQHELALDAEIVQRYQMTQNLVRWRTLMSNPAYASEVAVLMAENPGKKLYFVTGFLTTKGTKWDLSESKSRMGAARIKAPTGMANGLGPEFDVAVKAGAADAASKQTVSEVEQREIFAISYDVLKPPRSKMPWRRPTASVPPILASQYRIGRDHLTLGDDDSDEEIGDEELEDGGLALVIDEDSSSGEGEDMIFIDG